MTLIDKIYVVLITILIFAVFGLIAYRLDGLQTQIKDLQSYIESYNTRIDKLEQFELWRK